MWRKLARNAWGLRRKGQLGRNWARGGFEPEIWQPKTRWSSKYADDDEDEDEDEDEDYEEEEEEDDDDDDEEGK